MSRIIGRFLHTGFSTLTPELEITLPPLSVLMAKVATLAQDFRNRFKAVDLGYERRASFVIER